MYRPTGAFTDVIGIYSSTPAHVVIEGTFDGGTYHEIADDENGSPDESSTLRSAFVVARHAPFVATCRLSGMWGIPLPGDRPSRSSGGISLLALQVRQEIAVVPRLLAPQAAFRGQLHPHIYCSKCPVEWPPCALTLRC